MHKLLNWIIQYKNEWWKENNWQKIWEYFPFSQKCHSCKINMAVHDEGRSVTHTHTQSHPIKQSGHSLRILAFFFLFFPEGRAYTILDK